MHSLQRSRHWQEQLKKEKKRIHYEAWGDRISKMKDGGSSDLDRALWTLVTNKRWLAVWYSLLISACAQKKELPFGRVPLRTFVAFDNACPQIV